MEGSTALKNVTSPVTEFIRTNPVLAGSVIAAGIGGTVAVVRATTKRRKARKTTKRKVRRATKRKIIHRRGRHVRRTKARRQTRRKRQRVTHSRPRHKGHKRVSFTTAGGKRVSFLSKR